MRITVRVSDDLLRRAKKKATEEGRTFTSLLEEGLRTVLANPQPRRRTRVRVPIASASGGTLPGIDLNRSGDLEDQMQDL